MCNVYMRNSLAQRSSVELDETVSKKINTETFLISFIVSAIVVFTKITTVANLYILHTISIPHGQLEPVYAFTTGLHNNCENALVVPFIYVEVCYPISDSNKR